MFDKEKTKAELIKRIALQDCDFATFRSEIRDLCKPNDCPSDHHIRRILAELNGESNATLKSWQEIWVRVLGPSVVERTYQSLRDTMRIEPHHEDQARKLMGCIRYFRPNSRGEIQFGGLYIFEDQNAICFYHFREFSHLRDIVKGGNKPPDDHPEITHRGFFFRKEEKLHFLGLDSAYLRLAIALFSGPIETSIFGALVVSTDDGGALFAARARLIHEKHEKEFNREWTEEEALHRLEIKEGDPGLLNVS